MGRSKLHSLDTVSGTLAQRVYLVLKQAILSLAYRPGEILRKGEICTVLGVSRSPVSEAIARLETDGLVDVIAQAGTFVARFSMDEIREGAFLREALELAAIDVVAKIISDDDIAILRQNFTRQQTLVETGDIAGFYKLDREMHELLLTLTGYRRLVQIAHTAWLNVDRARQLILPKPGRIRETLCEHAAIIEAVAAHDRAGARAATRQHLRQLILHLQPLEHEQPDLFVDSSTSSSGEAPTPDGED